MIRRPHQRSGLMPVNGTPHTAAWAWNANTLQLSIEWDSHKNKAKSHMKMTAVAWLKGTRGINGYPAATNTCTSRYKYISTHKIKLRYNMQACSSLSANVNTFAFRNRVCIRALHRLGWAGRNFSLGHGLSWNLAGWVRVMVLWVGLLEEKKFL